MMRREKWSAWILQAGMKVKSRKSKAPASSSEDDGHAGDESSEDHGNPGDGKGKEPDSEAEPAGDNADAEPEKKKAHH